MHWRSQLTVVMQAMWPVERGGVGHMKELPPSSYGPYVVLSTHSIVRGAVAAQPDDIDIPANGRVCCDTCRDKCAAKHTSGHVRGTPMCSCATLSQPRPAMLPEPWYWHERASQTERGKALTSV